MHALEHWPETALYLPALKLRLDEDRLRHVLSVAEWLDVIAEEMALDPGEARTAALLHDYCRQLDNGTMLAEAARWGVPVDEVHERRPILLHGPVAAEIARAEYGVHSATVYEAIYWHTTGKPELCLLGQALYLADFSEPLRDYPEAAHTRELLRDRGFGPALRFAAREKRAYAEHKRVTDDEAILFDEWLATVYPDAP